MCCCCRPGRRRHLYGWIRHADCRKLQVLTERGRGEPELQDCCCKGLLPACWPWHANISGQLLPGHACMYTLHLAARWPPNFHQPPLLFADPTLLALLPCPASSPAVRLGPRHLPAVQHQLQALHQPPRYSSGSRAKGGSTDVLRAARAPLPATQPGAHVSGLGGPGGWLDGRCVSSVCLFLTAMHRPDLSIANSIASVNLPHLSTPMQALSAAPAAGAPLAACPRAPAPRAAAAPQAALTPLVCRLQRGPAGGCHQGASAKHHPDRAHCPDRGV
jgi:hypothetical protein